MLAAYARLNITRPLVTKGVSTGVLLGAGDCACQLVEQRHERSWDVQRTGRMLLWGGLFNGPLGHVFYETLERVVLIRGARGIVARIAIDQLLYTPPLTFLYFCWQHALTNPSATRASDAAAYASEHLWPTLRVNWTFWSAVHVVTFTAVPLDYRVAFVAVKNCFWGAYLSWAASSPSGGHERDEAAVAREVRLARTVTH